MSKKLIIFLLILGMSIGAQAQISIPNTFSPNTTISSSAFNANFTEIGNKALNRTGGTLTGNLTVQSGVTIDGVDISSYLLTGGKIRATYAGVDALVVTGTATFEDNLTVLGTLASAVAELTSADIGTLTVLSSLSNNTTLLADTAGLNASALGFGTVHTARLGSGSADSTTYLRGDSTWQAVSAGVPSGMVAFTNSGSCPTGWSEYTTARGRVVVGLPSGGTNQGTVGTAFTNVENRTHTHSGPSHQHFLRSDLWSTSTNPPGAGTFLTSFDQPDSDGNYNTTHFTTSVTAAPTAAGGTGNTGTASTSDVVPYIQLVACVKS